MAVKHRIKIYSTTLTRRRLWYTYCEACDWEPGRRTVWPDGALRYGRPAWTLALGLGLGHLREVAGR
jgi:hypothetical protein